jgi:hypothetical protein
MLFMFYALFWTGKRSRQSQVEFSPIYKPIFHYYLLVLKLGFLYREIRRCDCRDR